jgi:hypothetical protein
MDTLEVLIAARAEVDRGWIKFFGETPAGVCALGGLSRVGTWSTKSEPYKALLAALPAHHCAVSAFNDDFRTKKADVLALYDRAITAEAVKVTADTAHTFATVS